MTPEAKPICQTPRVQNLPYKGRLLAYVVSGSPLVWRRASVERPTSFFAQPVRRNPLGVYPLKHYDTTD